MARPAFTLCRGCGKEFTGTQAFDDHRTGSHEEDTRRCLSTEEMAALGSSPDEAGRWPRKPPKRLQ